MNPRTFRNSRWGSTFLDGGITELKKKVHAKRPRFVRPSDFPLRAPIRSKPLELISWAEPHQSNLAHHDKTIMFVLPWLYVGGADIGALHMIQLYAEMGYRVTVLCTLYKPPEGIELRPYVLQWTHDVHIMPSFLRAHDFPRYIKHLINSRGIGEVIISNSQLVYEMLPALAEQLPHVKFIDVRPFSFFAHRSGSSPILYICLQYLHNEAYDGWKSGGYPEYSIISQRYLARTITCSEYLKTWLVDRGHNASRIGVVKLGIELRDFSPVRELDRINAKEQLLDLVPEALVVTFVGRLDPQKRPLLIPLIVQELLRLHVVDDFQFIMLGDGPLHSALVQRIEQEELDDFVRVLGTVGRPQDFLAATDIFLLPSVSEGISIAVAEAMAMELPIVTARAGALPEQLGDGTDHVGGILVNHTLADNVDATLYATELMKLFDKSKLRKSYGAEGRRNVEKTFDWHDTLAGLAPQLALAENLDWGTSGVVGALPNPAAYLAVQTVLLEAWHGSDMVSSYGKYES